MTDERGPAWASKENPVTITASNGQRIRCWPFDPGGVSMGSTARIVNIQWMFQNDRGRHVVGPPAHPGQTMEDLQRFVDHAAKRGDLL